MQKRGQIYLIKGGRYPFIQVERRIGLRIEHCSPGRPVKRVEEH